MSETERPQITLITPTSFALEQFAETLRAVLDAHRIACLRLSLAAHDDAALARAADRLREIAHAHDVAIVVDNHVQMIGRHGLDGIHLTDTRASIRKLRADLGPDAIIGAFCGTTRHDGINAAEAGADYVAFGPIGETALGSGARADHDLFAWWSEMIEVPVIAEGALTAELVARFAPVSDFLGIGVEIWSSTDPVKALAALLSPISN